MLNYIKFTLAIFTITLYSCTTIKEQTKSEDTTTKPQFKEIDFNEFQAISQDPKAIIIDVREPEELIEDGFIENSTNIPVGSIEEQWENTIKTDKDTPILTYCRSGVRSARAATKLINMGFKNVYSLKGGIMAWKENNQPIMK